MSRVLIKSDLLTENNKDNIEKYVCPKCDGILRDAVQTSCGHWLCNDCAEEIFDKKETTPCCPRTECGEELTTEEGRPFFLDRFVRKEINRFSIMCPNCKFGCDWNGKISEFYAEHLGSCVYEKEECPHCKKGLSLSEYQSHVNQCLTEYEQSSGRPIIQGSRSFGYLPEEHTYCAATALDEMALKQSQCCLGLDQGSCVQDLNDSSSVSSLRAEIPSQIHSCTAIYTNTDGPGPIGSDLVSLEDSAGGGYGDMRGGRVDGKLMSLAMTKITEMQAESTKKDSQIHALQDKMAQLETTLSTMMSENEDQAFRLSLIENSNFDGSMVWKIPQFSQRMDDARTGKYTSIFSPPFYSSRNGYKICLCLYILGDGIGKGTHMSLFFVLMKGEFDNILQWPFTHKVTFKLINQCGARDIMDIFQPDPLSSSFQKPRSDMNVASGCPRFVSMNELMQGGFIVDDTIFIKVKVDTATMRDP
ncbi:PREDICTED: TNF receptor-associated factor 3-like [Amphimedon queenslandica]|uniref:RING-type E3 ubiquitin transferase n=1 Tax=Amphimedon queenslandica TaxID=400682 RepID=A0A1X7TA54_AMPQE|nr:PREDICTED: TNF receptor-associated factor 3-like [Amphimedon queenslandica]|eukprot:XP_019860774.1 PREDICTED: TNF receptor-associated factor 3-like [Amphimedon queenslandica]